MVVFSRILTGIGVIIIMLPLVCATGCNRDQSSSTQQAPSSSSASSADVQNSPAAVTQSSSTADTAASTTGTTTTSPSGTAATDKPSSAPAVAGAQTSSAKAGPENYSQVKVGMTSKEVLDLMGKASKIEQEGQTTEWEYYLPQGGKFELHLQNDKVISTSRR